MSRLTVRPRILAIFTDATLTASETAADFKTRSGSVVYSPKGEGAAVDLWCRPRQADQQARRVMMSDRFVSALGMVASGLRLFQLPYCVIRPKHPIAVRNGW